MFGHFLVVWYHPQGIANILSLSRMKERGYRVTKDSHDGNRFTVHKDDGSARVFEESSGGLYLMETSSADRTPTIEHGTTVMVNTVADNRTTIATQ
jgi:hypothetical protein